MKRILKITAIWEGSEAWALCSGHWEIYINDVLINLPEEIQTSNMNTYGKYDSWHFNDWQEEWQTYTDGLYFNEWIQYNDHWVIDAFRQVGILNPSIREKIKLYKAISASDWRHLSCGGCI